MEWLLLGLFIIIIFLGIRSNKKISISNHKINSLKLNQSFDGYTIVQVSDLHNALFGKDQSQLIQAISAQKPDLIVLTGDMIGNFTGHYENALILIQKAVKIAQVIIVDGNHEARLENYPFFRKLMIEAGAIVLEDASLTINSSDDSFNIIGLKERQHVENRANFIKDQIDPTHFQLLLAHHPENFENYVEINTDLVLCGHAHGGQFRFFGVGLFSPNQGIFPTYTSGAYHKESTTMIVSRGLGESALPIRLFNGPELVVISLHSQ